MADTSDILDEDLLEEFASEWTDDTQVDFDEKELKSDFTQQSTDVESPTQAHLDFLLNSFGHKVFRPLQWRIINSIMNKKEDNCAIMATGYGKSLCFQYPAVYTGTIALIISPLISLMEDQVLAMKIANIPACLLGSANSKQSETIREIFERKFNLVYLTPEFCCGEAGQSILSDMYAKLSITLIAVDEAHCVSSWGHDFRPQYRKLWILKQLLPSVPILAVTATATSKVRKDIITVLKLNNPQVSCSGFDRPNFFYEVHPRRNDVYQNFKRYLIKEGDVFKFTGPTIIYCITRKSTEKLSEQLNALLGIKSRPYHAGMTIKQRKEVHEMFVKDKIDVVIATIAFGMGIDKPDIRQVIHHGISSSMEAYVQESGRAGRDGMPAMCVVMYKYSDLTTYKNIWRLSQTPDSMIAKKKKSLELVTNYLQSSECRRQFILSYFDDDSRIALRPRPDCCDNCLLNGNNPPSGKEPFADATWDVLNDVKNLITLIRDCPLCGEKSYQRFLRGQMSQKKGNFDLHGYMHGSGRGRSIESWENIVSMLVKEKYLAKKFEQKQNYSYYAMSVTPAGITFLEDGIGKLMEKNKNRISDAKTQSSKKLKVKEELSLNDTQSCSQAVHNEQKSELLQLLRDKRLEMARSEDCMPYMIASDRVLVDICQKMPCSMEELKNCQIEGFSEAKMLKYGDDFVNIVRSYKKIDIPVMKKTIQQILLMNPLSPCLSSTALVTFQLFERYGDIKKVAEERSIAESTVFTHLILAMKVGYPIKLARFGVTDEIRNIIMEIIKKLNTGHRLMAPIKLACPEYITFSHIKSVVTYVEIREHLKKLNVPYEEFEDFLYSDNEIKVNEESDLTQLIRELESCSKVDDPNSKDDLKVEQSQSVIEATQEGANDTLVLNDEPVVKKMKCDFSALDSPPRSPKTAERQVYDDKSVAETEKTKEASINTVSRVVMKKKKTQNLPPWLTKK